MKKKKVISFLVGLGILSTVSMASVFASCNQDSNAWESREHYFKGFLVAWEGHHGDASTQKIGSGANDNADAYVYIEAVDSNGNRIIQGEDYGIPTAKKRIRDSQARMFQSWHEVKDGTNVKGALHVNSVAR